jgi:hypothetical protein
MNEKQKKKKNSRDKDKKKKNKTSLLNKKKTNTCSNGEWESGSEIATCTVPCNSGGQDWETQALYQQM